ncbi:STAS domain-containing protein [Rhodococcoides kyotonense]|uniref:Anti-anti-sigma regulatory factor (Antagonist of anti-sigma factor) n=1 Tax=Rhodococcoides kyotonense TaxID=398843 RepID=A0A239LHC3_9NOCA|nr:STAS domain-containing protein [Rhodococcus kyotonensis]SNT30006.1 Anti-anti-sigma regulatory factor (antagonist of anti-sigma factor) [Rhodococcus kyotonensis]
MTLLDSVHTAPASIRMSFCSPIVLDANVFAMSVDEPAGGPIVIRVCGGFDPASTREFEQCIGAALEYERGLVVDLLDVEHITTDAASILTRAAGRSAPGFCIQVACRPSARRAIASLAGALDCHETLAHAITAALPRTANPPRQHFAE